MGTKCITITEKAYTNLDAYKESKESFSDVINRLTAKRSLLELVGILSHKDADVLKKHRKEINKRMRAKMEMTASRLK